MDLDKVKEAFKDKIVDSRLRTAITSTEILKERARQNEKWGEQNHSPTQWLVILMAEVEEVARAILESQGPQNPNELLTPDDWFENLREELIQVGAVALAAVESLDRNELKK